MSDKNVIVERDNGVRPLDRETQSSRQSRLVNKIPI